MHELHHVPVRPTRRSRWAGRRGGTSPRCRPCRARAGRPGTGTSRRVPGPTGGCARRRCARSVRPSPLLGLGRPRPGGSADHLAERAVEPVRGPPGRRTRPCPPGAGGCAGRTSRRRRPARRPTARRHRRRSPGGRRARPTVAQRATASAALHADRERVDAVRRSPSARPGTSCAAAWARLRPPAVVASTTVTTRTGRSVAAARSATARTQAASVPIAVGDPVVLVEHPLPLRGVGRRRRRWRRSPRRDDDGVDRARVVGERRELARGGVEPGRDVVRLTGAPCHAPMPTHSRPRAASASASAVAPRPASSVTTTQRPALPARGASPAGSSKTRAEPRDCRRRCSPAPPRPAPSTAGVERLEQRRRATSRRSVRRDLEEVRRRDPRDLGAVREHDLPARPRREVLAREVRADGPEVLGRRHRGEPERHAAGGGVAPGRGSPSPAWREQRRRAPCASPRSATARSPSRPGGVARPICHVSAATARLAQL